jgi:hypothetical protein
MPGLPLPLTPRAGAHAVEQVSAVVARVTEGSRELALVRRSAGWVHEPRRGRGRRLARGIKFLTNTIEPA